MRTGHVHCSGDWNCGSVSEARNPARRNFAVSKRLRVLDGVPVEEEDWPFVGFLKVEPAG